MYICEHYRFSCTSYMYIHDRKGASTVKPMEFEDDDVIVICYVHKELMRG